MDWLQCIACGKRMSLKFLIGGGISSPSTMMCHCARTTSSATCSLHGSRHASRCRAAHERKALPQEAHACRRRSRKRSVSAKPIYSSTLRRISSHSPSPIARMCAGGRQLHVEKRHLAQRHTTSSTVVWPAAQRSQRSWRRGYTRVRLHWPQGRAAARDPALTARRVGRTGPHANEAHGRGTREVQRPAFVRQCAWVRAEGAGRPGLHRLVVHHALGELAHRHQRLAVVELLDDVHLQGSALQMPACMACPGCVRHVACCLLHAARGRSAPPRQPCICAFIDIAARTVAADPVASQRGAPWY